MESARIAGGLRVAPEASLAASLASVIALVTVTACSSSSGGAIVPPPNEAGAEASAPEAGASPEAGAASPTRDAATATPAAGECSAETTQTACITCCSNKHEDGAAIYFVALIDCMCLPANCQKDCEKTLCDPVNPQNADTSCLSCVTAKNAACAPTIKSACTANQDCVAFDACVGESDCAGK